MIRSCRNLRTDPRLLVRSYPIPLWSRLEVYVTHHLTLTLPCEECVLQIVANLFRTKERASNPVLYYGIIDNGSTPFTF